MKFEEKPKICNHTYALPNILTNKPVLPKCEPTRVYKVSVRCNKVLYLTTYKSVDTIGAAQIVEHAGYTYVSEVLFTFIHYTQVKLKPTLVWGCNLHRHIDCLYNRNCSGQTTVLFPKKALGFFPPPYHTLSNNTTLHFNNGSDYHTFHIPALLSS